jgi:hypothetical protein
MTDESRAALIAEIRAATIAECQRALRTAADGVVTHYRTRMLPWLPQALIDGYRDSALLLEALQSPRFRGGTEKAS